MKEKSLLVLTAELFGAVLEEKQSSKGYDCTYWYSNTEQYLSGAGSTDIESAARWYLSRIEYPEEQLTLLWKDHFDADHPKVP